MSFLNSFLAPKKKIIYITRFHKKLNEIEIFDLKMIVFGIFV